MNKLLIVLFSLPLFLFSQNEYSISFDGIDYYILINHSESLIFNEELTIQFWVKNAEVWTAPHWHYIISKGPSWNSFDSGFNIRQGADGGSSPIPYWIQLVTENNNINLSSDAISDQWENIAFVFNSNENNAIFYRDGVIDTNVEISGPIINYLDNLYFGHGGFEYPNQNYHFE